MSANPAPMCLSWIVKLVQLRSGIVPAVQPYANGHLSLRPSLVSWTGNLRAAIQVGRMGGSTEELVQAVGEGVSECRFARPRPSGSVSYSP